jgi:hypothetical protein
MAGDIFLSLGGIREWCLAFFIGIRVPIIERTFIVRMLVSVTDIAYSLRRRWRNICSKFPLLV